MKTMFSVKNWNEFQHYKDRNPPWIKLHNHLLDDYDFEMLGDAAKGHLLCIWMLASRTKNEMPFDDKWITKKIGASTKVNLQALVDAEFLTVEHDASTLLHNEAQVATVSVPSVEKRRVEAEERQSRVDTSRFTPPSVEKVFNYCNERCNNVNAQNFVDHYKTNNWTRGKQQTPIKDWKACVRTWENKNKPTQLVNESLKGKW